MIADYLRSSLRNMAHQYVSDNLKPLNLQELSTVVTTFIGTLLYCHTETNDMLNWVRSGLYLAQTDLREHYKNPFVKMILDMKLPTQDDVDKCHADIEWNQWDLDETPSRKEFYEKADRLFSLMEKELQMYCVYSRIAPWVGVNAHYGDGRHKPLLSRIEALESKLKASKNDIIFNIDDPLNVELRLKLIVRRFLRRKMYPVLLRIKLRNVFAEWASEFYARTAFQSSGHLMLR